MGELAHWFGRWRLAIMMLIGVFLGLIFLGHSGLQEVGYRGATWSKGTVVANAEVVRRDSDGERSTTWAPIIQWQDEQGTTRTFQSENSTRPAHRVGSAVDIRYFPGHPESVLESETGSRVLMPAIGGLFVAVFGLFTWWLWPPRLGRRRAAAPDAGPTSLEAGTRLTDPAARTDADAATRRRTSASGAKAFTAAGVAFTVIAVAGLLLALWTIPREERYRDAVTTQARVVDLEWRGSTAAAVIEYTDERGEPRRYTSSTSSRPAPVVGSSVEVQYLPGRPDTVREVTFVQRWLFLIVGLPITVAFGLGAVAFFWAARSVRRAGTGGS